MKIKDEYFNCCITQPATAMIINVNSIDPNDYQYYYNSGYQHLFDLSNYAPVEQPAEAVTEEAPVEPPVEPVATEQPPVEENIISPVDDIPQQ